MNNKNSHGNVYGIAGDEILSELGFIEICGETCSHDPEIHFVEDLGYDGVQLMHPWPEEGTMVTDNTKVKTDLALNFTSLKAALSKTYSWLTLHPDHFGRPSFRGERYVLSRRPIPEYVKIGWRLVDRAIFILRLIKQFCWIWEARFLVFSRFIKKWLRQRVAL